MAETTCRASATRRAQIALRARLAAEGLFSDARKKPLPFLPAHDWTDLRSGRESERRRGRQRIGSPGRRALLEIREVAVSRAIATRAPEVGPRLPPS